MNKIIIKTGVLFILFLLFSSCASSAKMEYSPAASADSGFLMREASASSGTSNETDNRMVTYTVSLGLSVNNVEDTKGKIIEQVSVFDGYITRESNNSITMRIPTDKMDEFIEAAKKYGKVENESKTGVDITEQYRDNVIRLENLKNVRDRYLTLLQSANTVTEILNIERELERVNTEIDILEGRVRFAEMSVAYSNITVRLHERVKPGPLGWIFYGLYRGVKWLFVWN